MVKQAKQKLPSVAQILLSEENQQQKSASLKDIVISIFLLYVLLTLLNIYFAYKIIFDYFSIIQSQNLQCGSENDVGPWKVVLALKFPLLKYRFFNSSTPQIIDELIRSATCFNEAQCIACQKKNQITPQSPSKDTKGQCIPCQTPYCVIQPQMMCGYGIDPPTTWSDSSNPFRYLIPEDAPIVVGKDAGVPQNTLTVLFQSGFIGVAETSTWTMPEFMDNVFSDWKPQKPCDPDIGAFISGVGSQVMGGIGIGIMAGGPVGAVVGGLMGAGLGVAGNYKSISC